MGTLEKEKGDIEGAKETVILNFEDIDEADPHQVLGNRARVTIAIY